MCIGLRIHLAYIVLRIQSRLFIFLFTPHSSRPLQYISFSDFTDLTNFVNSLFSTLVSKYILKTSQYPNPDPQRTLKVDVHILTFLFFAKM